MKKELLEKFKKNMVSQTYLKSISGGYWGAESCGALCASTAGCTHKKSCGGGSILDCPGASEGCYSAYQ